MRYLLSILVMSCALLGSAVGQVCVPSTTQSCTPNVGLATPNANTPNWNIPLNQNFNWLDSLLSGVSTGTAVAFANVSSLDNIIYVDGVKYALTAAGIQAAINQAQANGGGTVMLPPITLGAVDLGGTSLAMHSNVCLIGAGIGVTNLQWSVSAAGITFADATGTQYACVENMTLHFTAAAGNSTAIRAHGFNDPQNFMFNTIKNVRIEFATLTSGSVGIYASSDGLANATQIILNRFENIQMQGVDTAVLCLGCEGNFWDGISAYKSGITTAAGNAIYTFGTSAAGAPSTDEHLDLRAENEHTGSGGCFSITGQANLVRLTCDSNTASFPTIVSDGGGNTLDISRVGTPIIGSFLRTSVVRDAGSGQIDASLIQTNTFQLTTTLASSSAPTIAGAGCGGSAASISTANGTASFDVNVGTAPTSGGCTVTMPAATTRWNCSVNDYTTISTSVLFQKQTASTTTSIVLQNYSDVAVATAPTANDIYHVKCGGE